MKREKLVEIKGLKTRFKVGDDYAKAVDGVDFDIYNGEILGIVGESGSGKSVSVLSLIQLIPNPPGEVVEGEIFFKGEKIYDGKDFQRVMAVDEFRYFTNLNPVQRKWAATAFFITWLLIYSLLPISGLLLFLLSFILDAIATNHIFYNSPRKKALADFREKMYKKMRNFRGKEIAMIFQEPMTSLNPVFSIGTQVIEAIYAKSFRESIRDGIIGLQRSLLSISWRNRLIINSVIAIIFVLFGQLAHGWTFSLPTLFLHFVTGFLIPIFIGLLIQLWNRLIPDSYKAEYQRLWEEGVKLLDMVGIPDAEKRMNDYPHQFSGGMRQRVMIAMALAKHPSLLIADEPTTALDVTIQAQILELMIEIKNTNIDSAIVLITHDLAVVAETCERVIVMYGGKIQEVAEVNELFSHPLHPYTQGLLRSIPKPDKENVKERLQAIRGMVPSILNLPEGCRFCTRCDVKIDICDAKEPPLVEVRKNHWVRCHVTQQNMAGAQ
jgi:oligopeptide/dipeptide ABC transporter ATP-binding protein